MQFVLIIYHGTSPLPGSDAWKAMPATEHKAIYAEYAELNNNPGITFRLPPLAPHKATTVQVRDDKVLVEDRSHAGEGIGGAFVLDADDMEAAVALAGRIPQAR